MAGYESFGSDDDIIKKRYCGQSVRYCGQSPGRCLCGLFVVAVFCVFIIIIASISYNQRFSNTPGTLEVRFPAITAGPFSNAVVQAQHEACSAIGTDVLQRNGSVVDAAVAVQFCTGVMVPQSCGLGGGFFMTLYAVPNNGSDDQSVNTIVAREVAPAAILNFSSNMATSGGMSVAVPVEPVGLHTVWRAYGRLPWADLVTPTIQLLENGVAINVPLAESIQTLEDTVRQSPGLSALFVHPDGRLKAAGDVYFNPGLANTLHVIAAVGDDGVYNRSLAADMAADIQDAGGIVTEEDISNVEARFEAPVVSYLPYKDITIFSPPLPSGGVIVQFMLHLLDGFNSSFTEETLAAQRIIEAFKFGYARRSTLGDPHFVEVQQIIENLTRPEYVASVRRQICDTCTLPLSEYGAHFLPPTVSGTCGYTIIGPDGSAVATTSSINTLFGSKVVGQRTGMIFNNEMDDFSNPDSPNFFGLPPSAANLAEPGKSPLSSMAPSLIFNSAGEVFVGVYAAGGSTIISQIAEVVLRYVYHGRSLEDTMSRPRIHHQLLPDVLQYEQDFPQNTLDMLKAYGQQDQQVREKIATVGMVVSLCETFGDGCINCQRFGAADGRRDGGVTGF